MKVVLINIFFHPDSFGGATTVVEENAKILKEAGHEVIVLSLTSRPEFTTNQVIKTSHKGIINLQINSTGVSEVEKYLGNQERTEIFVELIESISPDIMHVHCIQEIGVSFIESIVERGKLFKTKKILSIHDYWWLYKDQFLLGKDSKFTDSKIIAKSKNLVLDDFHLKRSKRLEKVLGLFDFISTPSDYSTDIHNINFPLLRFNTVKNGINLSKEKCLKRNKSKLVYGFLGGPGVIKGFENILEALVGLQLERTEIICVKAHQSWYENMEFSNIFKVIKRFDQKDLDKFFQKIDILLFPSQWGETFGLAIREALNRKKWVITTDEGAQKEPISEGINGNIIGIGAKTTSGLRKLFKKYDKGTPISKSEYNYSYNDQVDEIIKIYES